MRDLNPKFLIEHCPGERISFKKTDRNTISLQYVAAERYARHAHTSFGYDVFRLEKCQSLLIESEQEILTRGCILGTLSRLRVSKSLLNSTTPAGK